MFFLSKPVFIATVLSLRPIFVISITLTGANQTAAAAGIFMATSALISFSSSPTIPYQTLSWFTGSQFTLVYNFGTTPNTNLVQLRLTTVNPIDRIISGTESRQQRKPHNAVQPDW